MELEDDNELIRLYCHNCDNSKCRYFKKLGYISEAFQQGCSREVPITIFEKYIHYMQEVIPL